MQTNEKKYCIKGMSCAACVARVEKAVSKVEGVDSCAVNLLTNDMKVNGQVDSSKIIKAVRDAGYDAWLEDEAATSGNGHDNSEKGTSSSQTHQLINRIVFSLLFLLPLMYLSMGHNMFGFVLPPFLEKNPLSIALSQLVLCISVLVINRNFFVSGFKSAFHLSPNMDTLISLGSGVSFVWSLVQLFVMSDLYSSGQMQDASHVRHNLYFESSAMILVLITVGKTLEAYSKGKTTSALNSLKNLVPKTVTVLKDGEEKTVPLEQIQAGDVFVVRPGDAIPVDGIIIEGSCTIDESSLTGESLPVEKTKEEQVFSGTLNKSGSITVRATKVGQDSTINKIIKMVSDAGSGKAPIAKLADKVSGVFVPVVLGIALVTFVVWLLCSKDIAFSLARAVSVLVISCPCALGLATPVAIMVGNGVAAKRGILFKTAQSLEQLGKIQTVILDKTGTITKGEPVVTGVKILESREGFSEQQVLSIALSMEQKSEHPYAKAIVKYAAEKGGTKLQVEDFNSFGGKGITCVVNGKNAIAGNKKLLEQNSIYIEENKLNSDKKTQTSIYLAYDGELCGVFYISDVVKEDSAFAVQKLKQLGLKVVMLSGDNALVCNEIASQVGIKNVISEVLPEGKLDVIRDYQKTDLVCMVGDGINDAPALTASDIGIAIGKGTDIAIEAGDVVLVKNSLLDVAKAIYISRKTITNIKQNLFWAFIYNIIGIPLAAGCYIHAFGWTLNPMFGALAMSLSSVCVCLNALRLNLIKTDWNGFSTKKTLEENMEKTVKVNGMMCSHCEMHVKKALEALDGVTSAEANHETGTVKLVCTKQVGDSALKEAVTSAGYEYIG